VCLQTLIKFSGYMFGKGVYFADVSRRLGPNLNIRTDEYPVADDVESWPFHVRFIFEG
jgi:hypothetical protein